MCGVPYCYYSAKMRLVKFFRIWILTLLACGACCAGGEGGEGGEGPQLLPAADGRAVVYIGSAGAAVPCACAGRPPPAVTWLAADFTLLPPDPRHWRVLSNGTLQLQPAPRHPPAGVLPRAVRCRATNAHGAVVSPPITLLPVWNEVAAKVEAGALQAGGVAALRCELPAAAPRDAPVRWWRNGSPLTPAQPTPIAKYVAAGQRGEWLLFDGAVPGDRYSCQVIGIEKSPPAFLFITDNMPNEMPRIALGETEVHVLAGSNLCLPCAAPDHPPPHYTWYRESGGQLQAAAEAGAWAWRGGAALCFTRVAAAGAGAWRCRAAAARGDATARVRLVVRLPLAVTLSPAVTIAGNGDTVRLQCQTSDPTATLSWFHMGAPVVLHSDITLLETGAILLRVTSRTRGLWQCEAHRGTDVEQATAELRLAEAIPELHYTFIEQALRAGARVALRCTAAGTPLPHFSWYRDNVALESVPESHRYTIKEERVGAGETVSTLNISSIAPEDGGCYTCRAANELGHVDHSARLNIYGPPLVRTTPAQRALSGENVTLHCPYAGYPVRSVTWQRGGKTGTAVGGEGRVRARAAALELSPALAADSGRYACTVTAPDGASATKDVQLLVFNPPKISPFMFSSELAEGNAVRVLCSVLSGDRPLTFSWLKDAAPISPDLQIEETSVDDFSLLKFGELTERHSGDYTCRVSNPAASMDYTASLHVKVPPTWISEPMDTAVASGAPLQVECSARGQPAPAVTWHRRAPCAPPAPCAWRALPAAGALRAPAAARGLAGLYRCSADNGVVPPLHKHINISVYEPAQIELSNEIANMSCVHTPTGVCALTCVARGDEPLKVTWTRARALDLHSGRVAVSETRGADGALRSELTIRAVSGADAGEYRCQAINTRGRSERLIFLHVEEPPPSPTLLRVRGRGARSVRVSWRGDRAARHSALLEQLRAPDPRPPFLRDLALDNIASHHGCDASLVCAELTRLQPGAAYSVRMRAASRAGQSPLSAPLLFTTLEDAPSGAPQDVSVRAGDSGELHVSWSPPMRNTWNGELLGYAVTWRVINAPSGLSDEQLRGRAVRRGGTSLVLLSLRARAQYSLTVRAFNRAGAGPNSPLVLIFTSKDDLEAPTNVRCSSVLANELRVMWTPDVAHRQYELLYAPTFPASSVVWSEEEETTAGSWSAQSVTAAGGAGEARVGGLRAATEYSVWVRARAGHAAAPAVCTTAHAGAAAAVVTMIQARGVAADSVRVWWLAPLEHNEISHYMLYVRDISRSEGEWAQRVEAVSTDGSVEEEPTHVVTGLRAHTRYEFWVQAHVRAGVGPPSPRIAAAPSPLPAEAARIWSYPRIVIAVVGARVRLRCGADGSLPLRRYWTPLPVRHVITTAGNLEILGVQLTQAGNYTCSVRNALGADSVTHTLRTRPAPEPPPAPAQPRLTRATFHELYITWDTLSPTYPPLLGYTLEWSRHGSAADVAGAGVAAAVAADTRARAVRGLACGARHRVRLRAHNARGASAPSPDLLADTAGYGPVPPAAGEFVWVNSSALRLSLLAWDAPCPVAAWRLALRPAAAAWAELRPPDARDDVVEVGDLRAGDWYEVRVSAHWTGGAVVAIYRIATLTEDGEHVGASVRLPAEAHAGDGGDALSLGAALLPAALAAVLALLIVTFSVLVWCMMKRSERCRSCSPPPQSLRPRDELPPPPMRTLLDYTLPTKCDISDIRVMSVRMSSAGSVAAGAGAGGACDSASDSSGEPCAACQRAAAATAHTPGRRVSSLRTRTMKNAPLPPAPARPLFSSYT